MSGNYQEENYVEYGYEEDNNAVGGNENETHAAEAHVSADPHTTGSQDGEATQEADRRSVYVGNVDYNATLEEIQEHFKACGEINRITIMVDKITGQRKGFAYVEFTEAIGADQAVLLSDTILRGRQIKVVLKRTNIFGYNRGRGISNFRGGRGAGGMMRGRGAGGMVVRGGMVYVPVARSALRGGAFLGGGGMRGGMMGGPAARGRGGVNRANPY